MQILNPIEAFGYSFFLRALIAVVLLSLILPLLGNRLAGKGFSMIADTLSHTSLAGIAIGLCCGGLPILWSFVASAAASILIEVIRRKFPKYSEIALAITLSLALGVTGLLSALAPANRFESYLFGSLFTVSWTDVYVLIGVVAFALLYEFFFYRSNLSIAYSEQQAKAEGKRVIFLSLLDTVVTSMIIATAANIIGSLLVASLVSIPVAIGLRHSSSHKGACIVSVIFSLITGIGGLFIAYTFNLHVGGSIVIFGTVLLILSFVIRRKKKKQ